MRALRLLLATGVSGLLGSGLAAAAAPANTKVVDLTNAERSSRQLSGLAVAEDLHAVAERKANDMAAKRELRHSDNLGSQVGGWNRLGENIGRGPRIEDVHREFMASPTHSRNVLGPSFTQIGAGVAKAGRVVYVAVIYREPAHARPAAPPPVVQPQAAPTARRAATPQRRVPPLPAPAPAPPPVLPPPAAPAPPPPQILGLFVDEPARLPSEARAPDVEALVAAVLAESRAQSATRSLLDSLALARATLVGRATSERLASVARTPSVYLATSLLALATTGQAVLLRKRRLPLKRRPPGRSHR